MAISTSATAKSELLQILTERGFVHQCTDADGFDTLARDGHMVAYIGFDATADSLHVGSLIQVMTLRWLQKCGHKPIVLMGGGTTKVGDPTGKDAARQLLSEDQIAANIAGQISLISTQIKIANDLAAFSSKQGISANKAAAANIGLGSIFN